MPTEACCYHDGNCSNIDPFDCVQFGGLPRGPNTYCSGGVPVPGSIPVVCAYQACCIEDIDGTHRCIDTTVEWCTANQYSPMGYGTRCAEGFNCADEYDNTRCCFADGEDSTGILSSDQCQAVGGTPVLLDENCPDVPTDDQCGYAQEPRLPVGARHWDKAVCQNAILGPTNERSREQTPGPNEPGFDRFREGYFELVTRNPVRAMRPPRGDTGEPCRHQFAPVALDDDGYVTGVLCGDRAIGGPTRSHTITALAPDIDDFDPPGYARLIASYRAPLWTEVLFDSPLIRCGGAPA